MGNQQFVGIAEMKLSTNPDDVLVAPNLGSCVGVAVYDPVNKKGGLVHCLLPMSKSDPAKAALNPFMYVDTGVVKLLELFLLSGVDKRELIIVAAGGANINDEANVFEIGKKNHTVLKKILWKNNLLLRAENFGDSVGRTLSLDVGTGKAQLKMRGQTTDL